MATGSGSGQSAWTCERGRSRARHHRRHGRERLRKVRGEADRRGPLVSGRGERVARGQDAQACVAGLASWAGVGLAG